MRKALRLLAIGASLALVPALANAQQASGCAGGLGVSRVVEINANGGATFGQQQYRDGDFLKDGEVVLTFDDGPLPAYTRPVLAALDKHCTKATFFMVGKMALAYPDTVRDVASRGHTIGTHTWSHANIGSGRLNLRDGQSAGEGSDKVSAPTNKALREMELGVSAVSQALGRPTAPFFRFPYLAHSRSALRHLRQRNIAVFSIDVDSLDYRTQSASEVTRRVLTTLGQTRKGIILFHDIQPSTARALPGLLDALKARGYKVVHIKQKTGVETIASYDELARSTGGKKLAAAQSKPLLTRTPTWGMSGGMSAGAAAPPQEPSPATAAPVPVPAPQAAKPVPQRPVARPQDSFVNNLNSISTTTPWTAIIQRAR